ncbi:hypothetical protein [Nannocystis pusilla]|uniref:hypothetical protein n=1 Tax=Nannocystis pusilla TaxID=889268 RepID=UPI003B7F8567
MVAGSRGRVGEDGDAGSRRPRPGVDERRAALLTAAYATIADRGLEGLRTREVAARAGSTSPRCTTTSAARKIWWSR